VPASLLGAVTVTVLGLTIVLSEADNALQTVLPMPEWLEDLFERLTSGSHGVWASIFALVVAAPLAEEPVFRGLMLGGFLTRYSTRTAIITSALFFGIAHMNPWQFMSAAVFGVVAGWWVLRSGSLVPSLWGHAISNGVPPLVGGLGLEIRGFTERADVVQFQPLWFDTLGVVLLGLGLWWTRGIWDRARGAPGVIEP
jgi:membrane protease YdiL (CAAX protease family)